MKTSNNIRVLRIILVILPEHQSDTKVITMTMEILLEPTSNKLFVDSLKDGHGGVCGIEQETGAIRKQKNHSFQHQEQYEHVGPEVTRSQEGKRSQDDDKRLCLVDDLKEVQVHIQVKPIRTSSSLKS
ncbi:hypothetical protein Tco_1089544 [Tanacetum coccineum]